MGPRVTAILNLKGGVGKTTTVISIAAALATVHNKTVLVIDADSQCNTTEFFDAFSDNHNMATLLMQAQNAIADEQSAINCIKHTSFDRIDIVPASDALMDLDLTKVEQQAVNVSVLRILVETVSNLYDYVLIDCPPAFNAASVAALVAADDVIIPIKLDAFSLRGMSNLMRQIKNMQRINPRLRLAGCLPTMWYSDPQISNAEQQLRRAGLPVYRHIRRSDKVDMMTFSQSPLSAFSPKSAAAVDYKRFVAREYVGGRNDGL